jgi:hypothetical protein
MGTVVEVAEAAGVVTQVIAERAGGPVTSRARPSLGSVIGLLTEPARHHHATTGRQR